MWLALLALIVGLLLGFGLPVTLPAFYGRYLAVAVLAALDATFGGVRANMEGKFSNSIFLSGFFVNSLLAGFLTFMGDKLGLPLYYAAIFAFGVRIFQNLGIIRRYVLARSWRPKPENSPAEEG